MSSLASGTPSLDASVHSHPAADFALPTGSTAIVYCEGQFGEQDGKTANGLVRHSEKYEVLSVIDFCAQAGLLGKERVTNLKQIRDDYEHLLECTVAGRLVDVGPLPSPNKELDDTRSALRRRLEEHS